MADLRISQRAASDAPLMERNLPLVPGLHPPALFWAPRPRWIPGLYAPSRLMVMMEGVGASACPPWASCRLTHRSKWDAIVPNPAPD